MCHVTIRNGFQILGGKIVKNVQIAPPTTEIWPKQLNATIVSESVIFMKLEGT